MSKNRSTQKDGGIPGHYDPLWPAILVTVLSLAVVVFVVVLAVTS